MDEIYMHFTDFWKRPAVIETLVDILLCAVPIWVAVMIGLVIGWSWRPRFTGLVFLGLRSKFRFLWTAPPPGFGARRLWFAFTALSAFSVGRRVWSNFKPKAEDSPGSGAAAAGSASPQDLGLVGDRSSVVRALTTCHLLVNILVSTKFDDDSCKVWVACRSAMGDDGSKCSSPLGERVAEKKSLRENQRETKETGPTILRSRTVYEDATPELVRDFFWDDEFRVKWDSMLSYAKTLEECPRTGTMIVHWIKKFPFFCSDREYIFGRRIWESGKTYYCVTKSVPYSGIPKRDKPRRVELYFSSWTIKPVESRRGNGHSSACEVTLVHYEDMGIPKDIANLGVRHGMWGTVKKVHTGLRAYQLERKSEAPLSRSALMATITTNVTVNGSTDSSERPLRYLENSQTRDLLPSKVENCIDWRWIVLGGTVAVVCGLHTGVIGKSLLFGVGAARRLARK
ncbi:hypothetical protein Sjap_006369 [Stephania japonica]|uniref:START domain-containing protein n=1 Tax=Stephania japonica TaxID=461633 RepID=A0AAP0K5V9_9MAGN